MRTPRADAFALGSPARWTRWNGETEEAFRARVEAEAARLGVVPCFPALKPPGTPSAEARGPWRPDA
ncbi:MAG: hypothetical protein KGL52_14090 [Rhodospirillales bacterium]|nr:hypothetical protein [Rhodospirillales bacterium]